MGFTFVFSNGITLFIEESDFQVAVDKIKKDWFPKIFDQCNFQVFRVTGASLKKRN